MRHASSAVELSRNAAAQLRSSSVTGGRWSLLSQDDAPTHPLRPLFSLQIMERFLQGMHAMDEHYRTAPLQDNLPALLGLLNVRAGGVGPGQRGHWWGTAGIASDNCGFRPALFVC